MTDFSKFLNITKTCTCLPFVLDLFLQPQSFLRLNIPICKVKYNFFFLFELYILLYIGCRTFSQIFNFTLEQQNSRRAATEMDLVQNLSRLHFMVPAIRRLGSGNHSNVQHVVAFTTLRCLHSPQCCWR